MNWYLTIGAIYVMLMVLCQQHLLIKYENELSKEFGDNSLKYFVGVFAAYALIALVGSTLWPVSAICDVYVILKRAVR